MEKENININSNRIFMEGCDLLISENILCVSFMKDVI
jgi:hypothetical protein